MESHKLQSKWVLWSHQPEDVCNQWDVSSYRKHAVISTVEEFWNIFNGFKSLVNPDMWFFMRDGIPPIWEHQVNKQGGRYKFKIAGSKLDNIWLSLAMYLVTENICVNPKDSVYVSGISVSPKQHNFSTVSIWNSDNTANDSSKFATNIRGIDFRTGVYQTHTKTRR